MGPKKGRRVMKIEVPNNSVPEFEQGGHSGGYPAADIQRRRQETEAREREEAQQQHQREQETRRGEARVEESHSQDEGQPEKRPRTERSDAETAGREVGPLQSHYKKGHLTNIYLTDSDEEAIVDFVKDHEEFYNKTSEHLKYKAMKESLCEELARNCKLSVEVCKTWFDSNRTCYRKLTQ